MGQSNPKARCLRRARFTTGRLFFCMAAFVWADLLLPGARVSGATQINCWVLPVVRRSGGTQEPKAHTHTSTPETRQQWRQPGSHNPWCPEWGGGTGGEGLGPKSSDSDAPPRRSLSNSRHSSTADDGSLMEVVGQSEAGRAFLIRLCFLF